jgi:hypothetical protein
MLSKIILFFVVYFAFSWIIKTIIRKSRYNRDRRSSFRQGGPQGKIKQEDGIEDADFEEID